MQFEGGRLCRPVSVMHRGDVVRVSRVLHDHLGVDLDPVEHAGVRVQRVVVPRLQLGDVGQAPRRLATVAVEPHEHHAAPLDGRIGADPYRLLATLLRVRDQRVRPVRPPLPGMPGALDLVAHDAAADADVATEMLAIRVHDGHRARLAPEADQLATEVVEGLERSRRHVGRVRHDVPARWIAVGRDGQGRFRFGHLVRDSHNGLHSVDDRMFTSGYQAAGAHPEECCNCMSATIRPGRPPCDPPFTATLECDLRILDCNIR